ncbi:hypothetical protein [Allomuricauda sp. d1]|uniref:hypothetical protein n=1 Tax=Allomuricauda sp. d1 TaxID=3136725 RepID=UPI0031E1727E
MKKTINILIVSALAFVGCAEDFDYEDSGFILEELPSYVAFNPAGTSVTLAPVDTTEGETEEISVEIPGGTVSDVTVNYTFAGTAVFGTDFNVDGATSAGGSLTFGPPSTPNLDGQPVGGDIVVELLTDGVEDGAKTLEITLTSASNAEGELAIGRGGTDALRTAVVNIADADAPEE